MSKNFLIPGFAVLLIVSTCHAEGPAPAQAPPAVAIFLDPVQYKDSVAMIHAPQVSLGGYSPLTDAMLVESSRNPALAHQIAENSLLASHNHLDPLGKGPQEDGSPLEACRNYQMEQLGIALSASHSPLKQYLKDYSQTFGGKVQLATEVQLNSWSPMTINTKGDVSPELNIVEDGHEGIGLNFTPVIEAETTFASKTPKLSCKVVSADEITQIAGYQLARLKAKHLAKFKNPDAFKVKDLVSVVSSTLQTVPRFGYPANMGLEMTKASSDNSSEKLAEKSTSWEGATGALDRSPAGAVSQAN